MSLGWVCWGAERAHELCALFLLLSHPRKARNGNCERGCEGKLIPKKSCLSVRRGDPCISAQGYIIISKVRIYY